MGESRAITHVHTAYDEREKAFPHYTTRHTFSLMPFDLCKASPEDCIHITTANRNFWHSD